MKYTKPGTSEKMLADSLMELNVIRFREKEMK